MIRSFTAHGRCPAPVVALLGALLLVPATAIGAGETGPLVLWHGTSQRFGEPGTAQRWLNLLGRVSDPAALERVEWRLDDGPAETLALGPDRRRLAAPGDFNIELPVAALLGPEPGARTHRVHVRAVAAGGETHDTTVAVHYDPAPRAPLPFRIRWETVEDVQRVVQVVDGRWAAVGGGLRILEPGYDRAVALGDARWSEFEMLAEMTLHGIDEAGYAPPSNGPGLGFLTRWQGHVALDDERPRVGIWPAGTLVMYRWRKGWEQPRLGFYGNGGRALALDDSGFTLAPGRSYIVALRLRATAAGGARLGLKIWPRGAAESGEWLYFGDLEASAPANGSILFIAHHVDVTLGEIAFRAPVRAP